MANPLTKSFKHVKSVLAGTARLVVRRELMPYGVGVSNLTAATRAKRVKLRLMAGYTRDILKKSPKKAKLKGQAKGSSSSAVHQVKGSDPAKEHSTNTITKNHMNARLPEVFLRAADLHNCHCAKCDPDYHEALQSSAKESAVEAYNASITQEVTRETKLDLYRKNYKTLNKDAYAEVRRDVRQSILREEIQALKGSISKRLTSLISQTTTTIRQIDYEAKRM